MELMARGGMRIGEVLKLTPNDIDDLKLIIQEPKSGREGEVVFIPRKLLLKLNVNDAEGKIVLFGDIPAGSSKTLKGSAPFTFVLGNATKVKVSIDGRSYDIAPHIKGGVARFSLGEPAE